MTPKYTVLIPTRNTPIELFRRCLDSIFSERRDDVEVVAFDSSTTEEIANVCSEYRVSRYCGPESIAQARNKLFSLAQGTFFLFVDADDCVAPFLSNALDAVSLDADIYLFSATFNDRFCWNSSDVPTACEGSKNIETWFFGANKSRPLFSQKPVWVKLYRASIAREGDVCFQETLPACEDYFPRFRFFQELPTRCSVSKLAFIFIPTVRNFCNASSTDQFAGVVYRHFSCEESLFSRYGLRDLSEKEWSYEASLVYLPMMLNSYLCAKECLLPKSERKRLFIMTVHKNGFRSAICHCRFQNCSTATKKVELFVPKHGFYGIFFEAYERKTRRRGQRS